VAHVARCVTHTTSFVAKIHCYKAPVSHKDLLGFFNGLRTYLSTLKVIDVPRPESELRMRQKNFRLVINTTCHDVPINVENGSHTILGVVQVSDNMRNIDINKMFCRSPY